MSDLAAQILKHVFRFRRTQNPQDPCAENPCETCIDIHRDKLEYFLSQQLPIEFVILAFPAKSPNPNKVLGHLPDQGERLAVEFLQAFCEQLSHFHAPGARVRIASDGHVFGDLVRVPDETIDEYRAELVRMIETSGCENIDLYSLDDAFPPADYSLMREELTFKYATPLEELRRQVSTDQNAKYLFNGIHRFVFEDQSGLPENAGLSRNRMREQAKGTAYSVIQRSDAWSRLVAERFPRSLRLSIHPQQCHAEKIGFQLLQTSENWFTPWHSVALDDGSGFRLVRKETAEEMSATLVWRNKRPSHYVAPAPGSVGVSINAEPVR
ncbi:isocyanide synthase family protein [Streptomyces sp. LX-29]|uniref:isocyanide synthase family protein n=1 Tax=Streptomyces sp. LX-29 TaxID=2900152 RepID=UPI00240DDFC4|nr:isocyanide synthase family protein [Streptomyces sp. LX-29]WFB10936.1 isocyanide synthase family protein [Streptomyces sp. LX-29]